MSDLNLSLRISRWMIYCSGLCLCQISKSSKLYVLVVLFSDITLNKSAPKFYTARCRRFETERYITKTIVFLAIETLHVSRHWVELQNTHSNDMIRGVWEQEWNSLHLNFILFSWLKWPCWVNEALLKALPDTFANICHSPGDISKKFPIMIYTHASSHLS